VNGAAIVFPWGRSYSPHMSQLVGETMRKVVAYIESNLAGALFVGTLARVVGLSCSGFHRAFRLRFGVTPHVYVTLKRVELAQNLMFTTSDPLSQIALACGMTDQSHFNRTFRRVTGETPRQWRTSRIRQPRGAQ
jgi:AraC family transcriptional regulator